MDKSLEELEDSIWPEQPNASAIMRRCLELRKLPLSGLSASDIRVLLGQKIGLTHVVPMAIRILEDSPLIEADHYKGDLLCTVLDLPEIFWDDHPEINNDMVVLKDEFEIMLETIEDEIIPRLSLFKYK
ncbi:MAG: contact-dependent growth inhibition system immunity protein [Pseudomonadales bacterium]|nr:contact-dependent growth inhibition system immunity protein [Pseudomonadales bacterium]